MPASLLCLELTESLFAGNARRRAKFVLDALDALGVKLAIDDFGTGYSALAYLQDLPFDKLKIDRSFVTDIDQKPAKQKLFKGIVDLARTLGLEVVAEGAETDAEVLALMRLGADAVQGYAMARPMPADGAAKAAEAIVRGFATRFGALTPLKAAG